MIDRRSFLQGVISVAAASAVPAVVPDVAIPDLFEPYFTPGTLMRIDWIAGKYWIEKGSWVEVRCLPAI